MLRGDGESLLIPELKLLVLIGSWRGDYLRRQA